MILLSIILAVIFIVLAIKDVGCVEEVWGVLAAIFVIAALLLGAVSIFEILSCRDVDERIAMYEEQNAVIESQVETAVKVYMKHEDETFKDATPDSYITLVSLYPELKSDTLMQKQIDVYIENNNKICNLKEEKITAHRYKFWLYFGK